MKIGAFKKMVAPIFEGTGGNTGIALSMVGTRIWVLSSHSYA